MKKSGAGRMDSIATGLTFDRSCGNGVQRRGNAARTDTVPSAAPACRRPGGREWRLRHDLRSGSRTSRSWWRRAAWHRPTSTACCPGRVAHAPRASGRRAPNARSRRRPSSAQRPVPARRKRRSHGSSTPAAFRSAGGPPRPRQWDFRGNAQSTPAIVRPGNNPDSGPNERYNAQPNREVVVLLLRASWVTSVWRATWVTRPEKTRSRLHPKRLATTHQPRTMLIELQCG